MQIVIYNYLKIFFLVLFLLTDIPFSRNSGIPKGGRVIAFDKRIPVAVGFVEFIILVHRIWAQTVRLMDSESGYILSIFFAVERTSLRA